MASVAPPRMQGTPVGSRFLRKIESPSLAKSETPVRYPRGEIGGGGH